MVRKAILAGLAICVLAIFATWIGLRYWRGTAGSPNVVVLSQSAVNSGRMAARSGCRRLRFIRTAKSSPLVPPSVAPPLERERVRPSSLTAGRGAEFVSLRDLKEAPR